LLTTHLTNEPIGPRLFTRAEALALLKIGETTLFWLQRTGKLKPIRIGSRVLFNAAEIRRIVARGATLTEAEKDVARKTRLRSKDRPPEKTKPAPSQKPTTSRPAP
jgi:hypothetical protein